MEFINMADSKRPTLTIQKATKIYDINESQNINQEMNDLSLEPKSNTPSKASGTKLNENSKSFKPRFLQNRNTGGK